MLLSVSQILASRKLKGHFSEVELEKEVNLDIDCKASMLDTRLTLAAND